MTLMLFLALCAEPPWHLPMVWNFPALMMSGKPFIMETKLMAILIMPPPKSTSRAVAMLLVPITVSNFDYIVGQLTGVAVVAVNIKNWDGPFI